MLPEASPYLPADLKQAWHLDKQSLKGIKRQKQQQLHLVPGEVAAAAPNAANHENASPTAAGSGSVDAATAGNS